MISLDILGSSALAKQIKALADADKIIGAEFNRAGALTVQSVVGDLRSGVGVISGELKFGISGDVKTLTAPEMEAAIKSSAQGEGGYDYAARLDKDGRMVWRRGKYRGRRTWGWFSYVTPRLIRKLSKKNYQAALDKAVSKMAVKS